MKALYKLIFLVLIAIFTVSCGKKNEDKEIKYSTDSDYKDFPLAEKGLVIFDGKGNCISCHKTDEKLVGPSLQDIAKIYKDKKGSIATFLNGIEKPIVDPSQFEVMKTNFAITKMFTDEERQSLEQYIMSFAK